MGWWTDFKRGVYRAFTPPTRTSTTTYNIDPGSRSYINDMRGFAGTAANTAMSHPGPFFLGPDERSPWEQAEQFRNPYQDQVIGGIRDNYSRLRGLAGLDVNRSATAAGAFGGSRHGVESAVRMAELDRSESQQVGNVLHGDFYNQIDRGLGYSEYQRNLRERQAQEPLFRADKALGYYGQGYGGPTGYTMTGKERGSALGAIGGLAQIGLGVYRGLRSPATGYGGSY